MKELFKNYDVIDIDCNIKTIESISEWFVESQTELNPNDNYFLLKVTDQYHAPCDYIELYETFTLETEEATNKCMYVGEFNDGTVEEIESNNYNTYLIFRY